MEKMTKAMKFEIVREIVEACDHEEKAMVLEFIDEQVEVLAKKAEKAKERAAAKRAEGDELRAVVKACLTDELQIAEDIVARIDGEGITKAKVVARLKQLVDTEEAVKEQIKVGDGKRMAYRLA